MVDTANPGGAAPALLAPGRLLIDGAWVDAADGATLTAFNPATGAPAAVVAEAGPEDVDRAVRAARAAFDAGPWTRMQPAARERLLLRLADLIEAEAGEIARIETLNQGKPLSISKGDAARGAATFRYFAGWITKAGGRTLPVSPPNGHAPLVYTRPEPVGVVAQIIPWNFPFAMACRMLAPALAAGCCVVLKPAEQTPLTALLLGELLVKAGIPAGVVNILPGHGRRAGEALVRHAGVDKIAFIGSTAVGKQIAAVAGAQMKRVSLELGGKNPAIAFADADPRKVAAWAANAIFFNAGQVCTSASRLYVHDAVYEPVMEALVELAGRLVVAPGNEPTAAMGPLVSRDHLARVSGYVDQAREAGARLLAGGGRPGALPAGTEDGYFFAPTIFCDVPESARLLREEVFGPVLAVSRWSDEGQVIAAANDTQYGLAAGMFTQRLATAHKAAAALKAGIVWVNAFNILDPSAPFGGMKQSGIGRDLGEEGLLEYLETKTVWVDLDQ